jgi:hypothetical protein
MTDEMKHLSQFIITAGKVAFVAGGRKWLMRQPGPEEAADGDSAWRIAYGRVMKDRRLRELAGDDKPELEKEARIRAAAAESIYMLPLLLELPGDDDPARPAFDVFDPESLAEFEALGSEVISEMTHIYFGAIRGAIREAKKKSIPPSSPVSFSASASMNGRSRAGRKK